jgi:beta-glucanase (GH16 family)
MPNQSQNGFPDAQGLEMGDKYNDFYLSFLPGQRLSSCTCPGEEHPGPVHPDGSFTARSCPEIDIFEAQVDGDLGTRGSVSQSSQFAPFNGYYTWDNATYATYYMEKDVTQHMNGYGGGSYQQAASVVSLTNQGCYEMPPAGTPDAGCYAVYGFQYQPGFASDGGQITWINDDKRSWKLDVAGMGSDDTTRISERMVSKEPMVSLALFSVASSQEDAVLCLRPPSRSPIPYSKTFPNFPFPQSLNYTLPDANFAIQYIIANLGMAKGFAPNLDVTLLTFPAHMRIDWVRIYQYDDEINIGCDPTNYPTSNYINR